MQVPFVANQGQADPSVQFYASTFAGTVFVTGSGDIVYSLRGADQVDGPVLTERFRDARPASVHGAEPAATRVSYLKGPRSEWRSGLPTFAAISLGSRYDGIDVRLSAHGNSVEKLFHVDPGADASAIRLDVDGASRLSVDAEEIGRAHV